MAIRRLREETEWCWLSIAPQMPATPRPRSTPGSFMWILSRRRIQRLALAPTTSAERRDHGQRLQKRCRYSGFNTVIVPQQGTTQKLDTVGDRMFTPVVYQNRGGTESLWATHNNVLRIARTDRSLFAGISSMLPAAVFPATPAQQQDWSNGNDGLWRWMPSIALDQNGNTVIGYSTSGPSAFPSARYAGRLVADPPNNLGQGEGVMFAGTASSDQCQPLGRL